MEPNLFREAAKDKDKDKGKGKEKEKESGIADVITKYINKLDKRLYDIETEIIKNTKNYELLDLKIHGKNYYLMKYLMKLLPWEFCRRQSVY